jgi:prepilin peptidase CpaA
MIFYGMFVCLFGCAAFFDVVYMRIPNILSIILLLMFAVAVGLNPDSIDWLGHGITGAAVFAVGAICFYLGYWGGGDVKLYAAGALWMGPDLILPFIVWVSVLAGLIALLLLGLRRLARLRMVARGSGMDAPFPSRFPRVLMADAGVPLGLPLAAAAILLSDRICTGFWVF